MKTYLLGACALVLVPAAAFAAGSWDGTWKVDVSSAQMPKRPDVYVLKDGNWDCKTCVPEIKVKADGKDYPVAGSPYVDSVAVKVVDDHTVQETDKKNGKVVGSMTTTIAADGKSGSIEFSDSSNTNGAPVTGKGKIQRVAAGPKGSHAVSGSWRMTNMSDFSDNGITFTIKTEGDSFSMSTPTGQSYTAKLDGTEAPMKGDPGVTSVSLIKRGKNTVEETDKRDGKTTAVMTMTISGDGKTISVHYDDKRHGTSMSYKANKQ